MLPLWLTWMCVAQSSGLQLPYVDRYEVIRPQKLREARQTRSLRELYPETVRYELAIEGRNYTVHLEKNRNLIGGNYTETRYSEDGTRVTSSLHEELCYYHGHVEGLAESSASVGICSGIRGFVRARQQVYLIEPLGPSVDGDHAVYRREHLKASGSSALYDRDQGPRPAGLFGSRSRKPEAAAGPQRFVELFVVVDHSEYERYGSETPSRILGAVNHVDQLYRPLNIRVLLVGLEIWTDRDHIHVDTNSEATLDNFLEWRRADLLRRTQHDNAQFVTGKDFDTDTVGLANKFAMCTGNSGGVNQDHHQNPMGLASTIAHEMGHNFGMSHDAAGCACRSPYGSENCVMAEKLRTGGQAFPEFFSSCSVEQLAEFMERARPGCLHHPGSVGTLAVGSRCGNGLLDPGEECDCGTEEECRTPCCDAAACRLTRGSQCAGGECCDRCQFRGAESVCRKSAGVCDLAEHCTGVSGGCPDDGFQMNGTPCSAGGAGGFCYGGRCPTRERHCWSLFGAGATVAVDECFELNGRGEEGANCGRSQHGYVRCAPENFKCGTIFCGGGGESITGKRAAYTVSGIECKLAVDDDESRNMDMVPDGTRCGPDKVCLGHACVDTAVFGRKQDCANKCNSNGVCNHKQECHCRPGWAPPHCDRRYADLPQGQSGIIAGVCAALSILLVVSVLTVGLVCCKRDNVDNYISTRKLHSGPGRLGEPGATGRPQISRPTLVASTATQICAPLIVAVSPSRAARQVPKKSSPSTTSDTEPAKPQPPSKPLPPLNKPQYNAAKPNPSPVPPVRPRDPPAPRAKPCTPPLRPAKPPIHRLT